MGTRSTYRIIEKFHDNETNKDVSKNICLVYVQYDGYPEGHPLDTAQWLSKGKVVNGISMDEESERIFNGAGCLAAQFIAEMKDGPGGVYMSALSSRGQSWEDYLYDIIVDFDTKQITYKCFENGYKTKNKKLFEGTPQ